MPEVIPAGDVPQGHRFPPWADKCGAGTEPFGTELMAEALDWGDDKRESPSPVKVNR